jgi:hypothetical protein
MSEPWLDELVAALRAGDAATVKAMLGQHPDRANARVDARERERPRHQLVPLLRKSRRMG